MRTATAIAACAALLAAAPSAFAQLATMRGTIPGQSSSHFSPHPTPWLTSGATTGSLHQCEDTTVFFFDSGNASPKTLVLLPQGQGPSGDTTLSDVEAIGPLQVIGDITTPDAQSFPFTLQIAAGVSFDVSGPFLLVICAGPAPPPSFAAPNFGIPFPHHRPCKLTFLVHLGSPFPHLSGLSSRYHAAAIFPLAFFDHPPADVRLPPGRHGQEPQPAAERPDPVAGRVAVQPRLGRSSQRGAADFDQVSLPPSFLDVPAEPDTDAGMRKKISDSAAGMTTSTRAAAATSTSVPFFPARAQPVTMH